MNILSNLSNLKNGIRANIIQSFKEIKPMPGSPQIKRYLSLIKMASGRVISGSGFSLDRTSAENSAIGECIERYCANYFSESEVIYGKYVNIKNSSYDTLNPVNITRYNQEQYLKTESYKEYNENEDISWVKAQSLLTNKEIIVPFELIYLCADPFTLPFRDVISTGLACGQTQAQALMGGFNECIERDSFMHFWLLGLVKYEVDLSSIDNTEINDLIEIAYNANLNLRAYNITTDLNVPTILTVVRVNNASGFYLGCACSLDSTVALKKSIEEGIGGFSIYFEVIHQYPENIPEKLTSASSLDDHPIYYLAGKNDSILEEILNDNIPKVDLEEYTLDFKQTIEDISNQGYTVIFKDITTPDIKSIGVNVVRVAIPELAYLSVNDPLLNCKRILKKAEILNKEINLVPHPFP